MAEEIITVVEKPIKETLSVTIKPKNEKRVFAGKKLAEYNKRKKEELKELNKNINNEVNIIEYIPTSGLWGIGVVVVVAIGGLLYFKFKKNNNKPVVIKDVINKKEINDEYDF